MYKLKTKIYCLKDENNQVKYIGLTKKKLKERLREHLYQAKNSKTLNHRVNWIRKCTKNNFIPKIELIVEVEGDGFFEEILLIKTCRTFGIKLVNTLNGGQGGDPWNKGYKYPKEFGQKVSRILSDGRLKGNKNPMYGKRHSEETKNKIRKCKLGKKLSEDHKVKIGLGEIGRKSSEESINKCISTRGCKRFICNQNNKIYNNMKRAAKELNTYGPCIYNCLKNNRKTANGYTFNYIENGNNIK